MLFKISNREHLYPISTKRSTGKFSMIKVIILSFYLIQGGQQIGIGVRDVVGEVDFVISFEVELKGESVEVFVGVLFGE